MMHEINIRTYLMYKINSINMGLMISPSEILETLCLMMYIDTLKKSKSVMNTYMNQKSGV